MIVKTTQIIPTTRGSRFPSCFSLTNKKKMAAAAEAKAISPYSKLFTKITSVLDKKVKTSEVSGYFSPSIPKLNMPTNFQTTYFGMHFMVTLFSLKRQGNLEHIISKKEVLSFRRCGKSIFV
jgi:hypothetical protein